jgi:predicted sugar kinase
MLKYRGNLLVLEITKLIQQIFISCKIPEDWKTSIAVPIFKKSDKLLPENYREVNLFCTFLKVTTKIINQKLAEIITLCDEQQGF